jgi:very-short-patch-repair endonuclease
VLSHGSAAVLWGFLRTISGPIDVSVPSSGGRRRRPGIRLHRCKSLRADQVTERRAIPVTTPARTISDVEGVLSPRLARRAARQAELAGYRLGVKVGPWTVDFLWRRSGLVVETDGYRYHRGSIAFEDDHARDLDLRRHRYDVRRFTYRQVRDEPERVAADLRGALAFSS